MIRRRRRPIGMNRRNAHISIHNPRRQTVQVKDKVLTKNRLANHGVAVPETLVVLETIHDARRLDWSSLPDAFVMKPANGSRGRGVTVVLDRARGDLAPGWVTPSGVISHDEIMHQVVEILDGEHSDTEYDVAMFEPLLVSHVDMAPLAPAGLPDVRVICDRGAPLMAMLRIPTAASGGRGNLHQGGMGAAIDMETGMIVRAVVHGKSVTHHPDTGEQVVGLVVPHWAEMVALAQNCSEATGLGYVGVDLIADARRGALVLEVNSHPGLEIQNVCRRPLALRR